MQPDHLTPVLAGAAVLVLALALVLLRRRRAAAPDPDSTETGSTETGRAEPTEDEAYLASLADPGEDEPVPAPDQAALVGTVLDQHEHESGDEAEDGPVEVRWLRAQVRTLEQTLERLGNAPAPAEGSDPAEVTIGGSLHLAGHRAPGTGPVETVDTERYRRRVSATLRGLAGRTGADEAPARTMARVVAAIDRLESEDAVERPVLPTVPAGTALGASTQPRPAELSVAGSEPSGVPRAQTPHVAALPAAVAAVAPAEHPVEHPAADAGETAPEPEPVPESPTVHVRVEPVRPVASLDDGRRRATRWSRRGSGYPERSRS